MAGNTKLNENERGVFALHGVTGYLIAVVLLLSILAFLTVNAISVQQANATKHYKIDQSLDGLKLKDNNNHKLRTVVD